MSDELDRQRRRLYSALADMVDLVAENEALRDALRDLMSIAGDALHWDGTSPFLERLNSARNRASSLLLRDALPKEEA